MAVSTSPQATTTQQTTAAPVGVRVWLAGAAVLGFSLLLFSFVQFATPGLAGNDGYYHIKVAYEMRQEGLTPEFDALPLTILNADDYYDHHFLYHLYLALFATTDPALDGGAGLTTGAKVASIILPSLAFVAVWWLLRSQRVPYAILWTLGLFAVSEAFLYRMSMPRAQAGALLLLVVGLQLLLSRRYVWLAPLGFAFVWFYNAFPLLMVVAVVYVAAVLLSERRLAWQAVVFPALGIGLGLLINPYFPENIQFIISHLVPKLGEPAVPVGNEWSPYRTWTLVENSGFALLALVLGVLAVGWQRDRMDLRTLVAFLLAAVFGLMLFQSRRFVEYFPPFALLFLAFAAAPLLTSWSAQLRERHPAAAGALPLLMLALLAWPVYQSTADARALMRDSKPADQYAAAALWLRTEAPAGAMIFQTDWDDFPRQYFYNSDVSYVAGLDPTFLQLRDQALYDEWVAVTRGKGDSMSQVIAERFGAAYVFSDLSHDDFIDRAEDDPNLEEIYRDEYAVIYQVSRP
jgi:hypothetical protein